MNFNSFTQKYHKILDETSIQFINSLQLADTLKNAILYSYTAGGKRIRPLLLLATIYAFNDDVLKGINSSCALEFIHTSSLIHDDLPAMDDDDYRRGKLTNHKVFGEAGAILAGDALLVNAFQLICEDKYLTTNQQVSLINYLCICSGANGMIGGQQIDIENENQQIDINFLMKIHAHKTGKLIEFALVAGAIIANQNDQVISVLKEASYHIGIAFQIKDDLLDVVGNKDLIGKSTNSDEKNHKITYVSLLGLDKCFEKLNEHYQRSLKLIKNLDIDTSLIEEIFNLIIERNK